MLTFIKYVLLFYAETLIMWFCIYPDVWNIQFVLCGECSILCSYETELLGIFSKLLAIVSHEKFTNSKREFFWNRWIRLWMEMIRILGNIRNMLAFISMLHDSNLSQILDLNMILFFSPRTKFSPAGSIGNSLTFALTFLTPEKGSLIHLSYFVCDYCSFSVLFARLSN